MEREFAKPCLSAVFVDYDNIYFSLKRKNEEAARRFAKDAGSWLSEIVSGRLISPTNALFDPVARRNVMSRCYGNPVPRKNPDQTTDMTSFPFVRHSFLRGGFEVIDCPPLTQQLKNSSDIRMVMDIRDLLSHDTYYDEFIILSGDADFTPLLHRLRAHARRTVVYANDHTAAPYLAICDGEIRESDLTRLLLEGRLPGQTADGGDILIETASTRNEAVRGDIIDEIVTLVREADAPVPLEMLADKVIRTLGHARTVGTGWAGAGNFRELLTQFLPDGIEVSGEPPYVAFERRRLAAPLNVAAAAPQPVPASYQPQLRDDDVAPAAAPGPASALGPVAEPAAMMDARLSLQDAARDLAAGGPARRAAAQDTEVTSAASLQPQAAARHERQSIGQAPAQPQPQPQSPVQVQAQLQPQTMAAAQPTPAAHRFVDEAPLSARASVGMPTQEPLDTSPQPQPAEQSYAQAAHRPLPQQALAGEAPAQASTPASAAASVPGAPAARFEPAPAAYQPGAPGGAPADAGLSPAPRPAPVAAPMTSAPADDGRRIESSTQLQEAIARIHDACQAPPLAPPEYRTLFDVMAAELGENGLIGAQTLTNIANRAQAKGAQLRRDDVRFILEVVSEADPWFDQGISPTLFAGRFRNFVVARCRSQGLNLSLSDLDLIEAWFAGGPEAPAQSEPARQRIGAQAAAGMQEADMAPHYASGGATADAGAANRWWSQQDEGAQVQHATAHQGQQPTYAAGANAQGVAAPEHNSGEDEFPRIIRNQARG